ncbi:hypothetical protein Hypma_009370 [Hypsizygus marmoreus]|uniref:Uncharacterized protein n=1 Tax=Hypsizygus marmoreus TaxID=39966 RepID=A0A369JMK7_HYPMA|nr:hypothetical protein Hypma_009370 [Hypsizygus marmoreus]
MRNSQRTKRFAGFTILSFSCSQQGQRGTKNRKPSKARTASTSSLNVWMLEAAAAIALFEATGWYIIPSLWPNQKGTDVLKITERTTVMVMKEVDLIDGFEQSKVDRYKYALCVLAAFNIAAGAIVVVVVLVWDKRPIKKPKRIRASEPLGGGNTVKRGK